MALDLAYICIIVLNRCHFSLINKLGYSIETQRRTQGVSTIRLKPSVSLIFPAASILFASALKSGMQESASSSTLLKVGGIETRSTSEIYYGFWPLTRKKALPKSLLYCRQARTAIFYSTKVKCCCKLNKYCLLSNHTNFKKFCYNPPSYTNY
jgi:hypothetical protein